MDNKSNATFFDKLKNLFSGRTIVSRKDGQTKILDLEQSQSMTNIRSVKDRFDRLRMGYKYDDISTRMSYATVRRELFMDYDAMDNDPIIASALDIYSDEATTKNEYGHVLTIKTNNQEIKHTLDNLFYNVLNVEFNLWPWVRNLCKYGDSFIVLEISPENGIVGVYPQSPYHVIRTENIYDPNRKTKNESGIKFTIEPDPLGKKEYDNYEVAHFRLYSDTNYLPYGKSMIENARRLWKQIMLMEDAMMIHRIMRAPEKRIFKIDIGNIPATEVDNYMQKIINKIKKTPFQDQNTGEYNLRYNMMNITEDFFMPVRGGDSGTNIETLNGLQYTAIEDLDYLKNKMFAALKIPKAFLGYEEDINGKATLAAEDVRFARTIERIQRVIVSELTQVASVHLLASGFSQDDIFDFELELTNPSTIYEQEKINLWAEKVRLANDIKSLKLLSSDFIYNEIFKLSEEEIKKHRQDVALDQFDANRLNKIENEGVDPYEEKVESTSAEAAPQQDTQSTVEDAPVGEVDDGSKVEENDEVDGREQTSAKNGRDGGRPRELGNRGTDANAFGRDPLGKNDIMGGYGRDTRIKRLADKLRAIDRSTIITESNSIDDNSDIGSENTTLLDDINILTEE